MADKDKGTMKMEIPAGQEVDAVKTDPLAFLQELEDGWFVYKLACNIQRVVGAVREHGKKGAVRIDLEFAPQPQFGDRAIVIKAPMKVTLPTEDAKASIRFADDDNTLVNNDKRQPNITGMKIDKDR